MIDGIIKILKDDAGVQAVIGNNKAGNKRKIFPGVCPQPEDYPYVVVRRTGKVAVQCKGSRPTMDQYSIQVVIYHRNYADLDAIELAIEAALDQKTGTYEQYTFKQIFETNAFDADYLQAHQLHVRVMEFEAMANALVTT